MNISKQLRAAQADVGALIAELSAAQTAIKTKHPHEAIQRIIKVRKMLIEFHKIFDIK